MQPRIIHLFAFRPPHARTHLASWHTLRTLRMHINTFLIEIRSSAPRDSRETVERGMERGAFAEPPRFRSEPLAQSIPIYIHILIVKRACVVGRCYARARQLTFMAKRHPRGIHSGAPATLRACMRIPSYVYVKLRDLIILCTVQW